MKEDDKMIELGIDECTVVLMLNPDATYQFPTDEWEDIALNFIYTFVEKAEFETVYGKMESENCAPQGYSVAYTFGNHSFYLAVAYHPYQKSMGVVVKFSAQALDYYCEATGIKVYRFLQKVADTRYIVRLSRIDLTADYIDEGIDITEISNDRNNGRVGVFRECQNPKTGKKEYRKCLLECEARMKEDEVQTLYLGSIRSNARLRIYNKRAEQIATKGTKFDKAVQCHDWVRFEACFRHDYAHQLTEELFKIQTDAELANLIAVTLVQKYRFMIMDKGVVDCPTEYTQMLIDLINNNNFALRSATSRNYELARSITYIFKGSGVMNTFYKCKSIWGQDAVLLLLEYISDNAEDWQPNDECRYWLKQNEDDYRKKCPDFGTYMRENVVPWL